MDRNQLIGLFLIGLILIAYAIWISPSKEELEKRQHYLDSLEKVKKAQITDTTAITTTKNVDTSQISNDSLKIKQLTKKYGIFANAAQGERRFITIQNDLMKIRISTKGGRVYSVNLLKYKTYNKKPLILFSGDKNIFDLRFFAKNKLIQTQNFYFEPIETDSIIDASKKEKTLHLRLKGSNDNQYVEFAYTVKPGSYLVDFNINFVNLDKQIDQRTTFLDIFWQQYLPSLEKSIKQEQYYTTIFYKGYKDAVENLNGRKDFDSVGITTKVRWIDYKQQFFSTFLIAKQFFNEAYMKFEKLNDTILLKKMTSEIQVPFNHGKNVNIPLLYYFGPNKYSILKKIKINGEKLRMEKVIPLGGALLAWINKWIIIKLFNFLGKFIHNYGLLILIMTLIIKLILFPLTYRSYVSMAKMRVLKPEIDKILAKIPEDKQLERQQKTMELYRKAGVSPLGGCLPMLLQLPILIAMYRFFPASIELRQKSFLWADDLSTYDAFFHWHTHIPILGDHLSLFTLLMAITLVINSLVTNTSMDSNNQQTKLMRFMFIYLMPILMIIWFNNYSAALSYYFFLSTLIGILQTVLIRKFFINEEKLLAQLKVNVKKNKTIKKSKWQQRLEQMAREQQKRKYR